MKHLVFGISEDYFSFVLGFFWFVLLLFTSWKPLKGHSKEETVQPGDNKDLTEVAPVKPAKQWMEQTRWVQSDTFGRLWIVKVTQVYIRP